jgi:signal peptidase I
MSDSQDPYNVPPRSPFDPYAPPERPAAADPFTSMPPRPAVHDPYSAPPYAAPAAEPFAPPRESHGDLYPDHRPPTHDGAHEQYAPIHVDRPVETASLGSRMADEFIAWLKTLASAAVYATLIVTFGFQVARVEGQSMAPTLEDQDRLIVNKFAYRIGSPQIGDIVMLYYPLNPDKSFVKRVMAEPGDQVKIIDGKVYRNDVLMDDAFVPSEFKSHDDWGPKVIDEGYYFVMGDHRNNSSDSRHWGLVPKKYIIGRVQLRWWPVPEARTF